jgi:hypothetical protein
MQTRKLFPISEQNPKREVVFTINANEEIYDEEYSLYQTFDQNYFACTTFDTITKKYTFIFNGERIVRKGDIWDEMWHLYYVNPGEAKGYIFTYKDNDKWFVNCRGVVDGGFDDISMGNRYKELNSIDIIFPDHPGPYIPGLYTPDLYTTEKDYDYLYKISNEWYASKNGENNKINFIERIYEDNRYYVNVNGITVGGLYTLSYTVVDWPYNNTFNLSSYCSFMESQSAYHAALTESGKYAYSYRDGRKWYVNVNGSIIGGPYECDNNINDLILTESGKYAYSYKHNGKYYVNVNGYIIGASYTYGSYNIILTESGKYAYFYRDNEKYYVNVNGSTVGGPYNDIANLTLTDSGKYAYYYKDNNEGYVNVNGSIVGRIYNNISDLTLTDSGKYAYFYWDSSESYINVNGSIIGGRGYDISLTEDGKYSYLFYKDRKHYINTNGVVTEKRDNQFLDSDNCEPRLNFTSKNDEHTFYSSSYSEYKCVIIDDRPYGKSPAIYAWYDESKNAFIWNAVEGRELVVYEYKLQ